MTRRYPKFCHPFVDKKTGLAYCYLRRRGYPLVPLPGLPWSPSFMAAYEKAMSGPRTAIGAGRIKPGSVHAVVSAYLDSQKFFGSKSAGTQRMRRGILERFRAPPNGDSHSRYCQRTGLRRDSTRCRRTPPAVGSRRCARFVNSQ